jgi:hypothetical protein
MAEMIAVNAANGSMIEPKNFSYLTGRIRTDSRLDVSASPSASDTVMVCFPAVLNCRIPIG